MATLSTINVGSIANDGTGDNNRTSFQKANANFGAINTDLVAAEADIANKQAADDDLTAIAALAATGYLARTASGSYALRTFSVTSGDLTITNGSGVSGATNFGLATTAVSAGTYSLGTFTVDTKGRLTSAANGSAFGGDIDVNGHKLVSSSNGDIDIESDGTGAVSLTSGSGADLEVDQRVTITKSALAPLEVNRTSDDGGLVRLSQDGVLEGSINVSGTTVSYDSFLGAHWVGIDGSPPTSGTWMESTDRPFTIPSNKMARDALAYVRVAQPASDAVCGAYFREVQDDDKKTVCSSVASIGGPMFCRVKGPATAGDLLTIVEPGVAGRQYDDVIRSSTCGKVWCGDQSTEERLVSVVIYCG